MKAIYFDMDGVLANLYSVDNWLEKLRGYDASPYMEAKPLLNMSLLARLLNRLQREGYILGVVSWCSKVSSDEYDSKIEKAKRAWLNKHLHSVSFDEIHIVPYGTPKQTLVNFTDGILFDDEERNRNAWLGEAYDEKNILETLKNLLTF